LIFGSYWYNITYGQGFFAKWYKSIGAARQAGIRSDVRCARRRWPFWDAGFAADVRSKTSPRLRGEPAEPLRGIRHKQELTATPSDLYRVSTREAIAKTLAADSRCAWALRIVPTRAIHLSFGVDNGARVASSSAPRWRKAVNEPTPALPWPTHCREQTTPSRPRTLARIAAASIADADPASSPSSLSAALIRSTIMRERAQGDRQLKRIADAEAVVDVMAGRARASAARRYARARQLVDGYLNSLLRPLWDGKRTDHTVIERRS